MNPKTLEKPAAPAAANPMTPRLFRVRQRVRETHDTFTLEMEPTGGCNGLAFAPGQFNMLYVYGVGEVPISISSDPALPQAIRHTTREVGVVTRAMRQLTTGDRIGIRGPFGTSWPVEEAHGRDVVLVAGGIGLAPLRPALYHLIRFRERYGKLVLLYGTRTPSDILFRRDLERWRAKFDLEVHVTVDRAMGKWRGHVGVVTTLIPRAPFDPLDTVAMICGPEIMMRYTAAELEQRGVPPRNIHVSMERNMKCGIGQCGHCQCGSVFVCRDGPVFRYDQGRPLLNKSEL